MNLPLFAVILIVRNPDPRGKKSLRGFCLFIDRSKLLRIKIKLQIYANRKFTRSADIRRRFITA